jgi:hypothetical protein
MAFNKYTSASMIVVPSGYKATKLYAQVPTDGDGDLTVTRASSKTRVNSSSLVETIAANVPALDYSLGSCPALALDPAATNLILQSQDFSTTWVAQGSASVTANTTASPSGGTDADTITMTVSAADRVFQAVTMTVSTTYTMSLWARSASGTKGFRLSYFNGSAPDLSSDFTATTDWQRFEFTFTTDSSHSGEGVHIYNLTGGQAGDLIVWGAQLELGAYATGYIPTTTLAVARSADAVTLASIITNGIIGATTGTILINGKINAEAGNINLFRLSDGTVNNRITVLNVAIQATTGGIAATVANSLTADADGYFDGKIAIRWNGTNVRVYRDGSAIGNANFTAGASLTDFELNGKNDTSWIREVIFYDSALGDTDMATITT